jgi:hypothetical protein
MKKNFFYIFSISVLLQGCSMDDDVLNPSRVDKANFPSVSEEYGKAVAGKLREMVTSLNELGVDYSDADNSPEFKQRFYEDLNKAISPDVLRSVNSITQTQMSPDAFANKISNLTEIQIEFVERIIKECGESTSYEDLSKRLIVINKDISAAVPEIQQERLFNVTAVLYYGVNEIRNLEKQGQMIPTPYNAVRPMRLKSGDESGGGWGPSCRKFLAAVWTIAVGEPTPAGEIVASVITVFVVGVLMYEVITCTPENTTDCTAKVIECYESNLLPDWQCTDCLRYCQGQGVWDCPRSY